MAKGNELKGTAKHVKHVRGPIKYLKEVRSELKKVSWPSRKELKKFTIVVIITVIIMAAALGLIDYGLSNLLELII